MQASSPDPYRPNAYNISHQFLEPTENGAEVEVKFKANAKGSSVNGRTFTLRFKLTKEQYEKAESNPKKLETTINRLANKMLSKFVNKQSEKNKIGTLTSINGNDIVTQRNGKQNPQQPELVKAINKLAKILGDQDMRLINPHDTHESVNNPKPYKKSSREKLIRNPDLLKSNLGALNNLRKLKGFKKLDELMEKNKSRIDEVLEEANGSRIESREKPVDSASRLEESDDESEYSNEEDGTASEMSRDSSRSTVDIIADDSVSKGSGRTSLSSSTNSSSSSTGSSRKSGKPRDPANSQVDLRKSAERAPTTSDNRSRGSQRSHRSSQSERPRTSPERYDSSARIQADFTDVMDWFNSKPVSEQSLMRNPVEAYIREKTRERSASADSSIPKKTHRTVSRNSSSEIPDFDKDSSGSLRIRRRDSSEASFTSRSKSKTSSTNESFEEMSIEEKMPRTVESGDRKLRASSERRLRELGKKLEDLLGSGS